MKVVEISLLVEVVNNHSILNQWIGIESPRIRSWCICRKAGSSKLETPTFFTKPRVTAANSHPHEAMNGFIVKKGQDYTTTPEFVGSWSPWFIFSFHKHAGILKSLRPRWYAAASWSAMPSGLPCKGQGYRLHPWICHPICHASNVTKNICVRWKQKHLNTTVAELKSVASLVTLLNLCNQSVYRYHAMKSCLPAWSYLYN